MKVLMLVKDTTKYGCDACCLYSKAKNHCDLMVPELERLGYANCVLTGAHYEMKEIDDDRTA